MEGDGANSKIILKNLLLVINCAILAIGAVGTPLLMRVYYIHGGKRVWLTSWLQTAAWPAIIVPLAISYIRRRRHWADVGGPAPTLVLMKPTIFFAAAFIGVLSGLSNYFYAYGGARLPASTSTLIIATQLAYTAVVAFLLVNLRLTPYSINSVVLLILGAVVLGIHAGGDRPEGESDRQYMLGFMMTVAAAALYGSTLPLVELSYNKAKQIINFTIVLEYQLVLCFVATMFCTVGMLINKDFQAIPREAKSYGLGEFKYYMVLVWFSIASQCFYLGAIAVIFSISSLASGILMTFMGPVAEVLAVILLKEKFQAEKGVSLVLSIWGFISYFYGEIKQIQKNKNRNQNQIRSPPPLPPPPETEMMMDDKSLP